MNLHRLLTGVGLISVLCSPAAAAADAGRLIGEVETDIRKMARALSDIDDDRDMRGIDRLINSVKEANKSVIALARVAAGNERAIRLVEEYPGYLNEFGKAVGKLGQLKSIQFAADGLDDTCRGLEHALEETVDEIVEEGDPDGADEIEATAMAYASQVDDSMSRVARVTNQARDLARDIKRFHESDGPWRDVAGTLASVVDSMNRHLTRQAEAAERACAKLEKGINIDYVKSALEELEDRDAAIDSFVNDVETWFGSTRSVFSANCEALSEIRAAYCVNDYEPEEDVAAARELADQIANDTAQNLVRGLSPLVRDHTSLERRGRRLQSGGHADEVAKRLQGMNRRVRGLQRIQQGGALKGSRNPLIQTWINYGVQQHESLAASTGCDVADRRIPESGRRVRPDCISLRDCRIYEFKPDNNRAKSQGRRQVATYTQLLETYLEKLAARQKTGTGYDQTKRTGNPSSFGGEGFVEQAWTWGCIDQKGRARLESGAVITYKSCADGRLECPTPD